MKFEKVLLWLHIPGHMIRVIGLGGMRWNNSRVGLDKFIEGVQSASVE